MVDTVKQLDSRLKTFDVETTRQVNQARSAGLRSGNPDAERNAFKVAQTRRLQRQKIIEMVQFERRKAKPRKPSGKSLGRKFTIDELRERTKGADPKTRAERFEKSRIEGLKRLATRGRGQRSLAISELKKSGVKVTRRGDELVFGETKRVNVRTSTRPTTIRIKEPITTGPELALRSIIKEPDKIITKPVNIVSPFEFEKGLIGLSQKARRKGGQAKLERERRFARGENIGGFISGGKEIVFGFEELVTGFGGSLLGGVEAQERLEKGIVRGTEQFLDDPRETTKRVATSLIEEPGRTTSIFLVPPVAKLGGKIGKGIGKGVAKVSKKPTITTVFSEGRRIDLPSVFIEGEPLPPRTVDILKTELLAKSDKIEVTANIGSIEVSTGVTPQKSFTVRELGGDITVKTPFGKTKEFTGRETAVGVVEDNLFFEKSISEIAQKKKGGIKKVQDPIFEFRVGGFEDLSVVDGITKRKGFSFGFDQKKRPSSISGLIEESIPLSVGGDFSKIVSGGLKVDKDLTRFVKGFDVVGVGRKGKLPKTKPLIKPPKPPKKTPIMESGFQDFKRRGGGGGGGGQRSILAPPKTKLVVSKTKPSIALTSSKGIVEKVVLQEKIIGFGDVGSRLGSSLGATISISQPLTRTASRFKSRDKFFLEGLISQRSGVRTGLLGRTSQVSRASQIILVDNKITPILGLRQEQITGISSLFREPDLFKPPISRGGTSLFGGGLGVPGKPGLIPPIFPVLSFGKGRKGGSKKFRTKRIKASKPSGLSFAFDIRSEKTVKELVKELKKSRGLGPRPFGKKQVNPLKEISKKLL